MFRRLSRVEIVLPCYGLLTQEGNHHEEFEREKEENPDQSKQE